MKNKRSEVKKTKESNKRMDWRKQRSKKQRKQATKKESLFQEINSTPSYNDILTLL